MTSISIPDFVFQMFIKKITEINLGVVKKLCEKYNINEEEAKTYLETELKMDFNVVSEEIEQIKVVKKHKKPDDIERKQNDQSSSSSSSSFCDARVFVANELIVKQCSRSKLEGCNFCKSHQKLYEEGKLKYGTIHEPKPDILSTEKLKMRVKRNIY